MDKKTGPTSLYPRLLGLVFLAIAIAGCGGSGGGGEPGVTTFAKVFGENMPFNASSVLATNNGYRVYGSANGDALALLELDNNGNQVGNAEIAQSSSSFATLNDMHRLLPDGRLNVSFDINRTRNLYTLHVNREQFSSDLSQPPSRLWQHAQVMDFSVTLWSSADSDINGFPASLQNVEVLQVESAVSSTGFQGAFVLVRETAYVETSRYGITRRTRLLLFHYDSTGGLQTIKQVDERTVPNSSEWKLFKRWVDHVKLAVAHSGSYAIAIPRLQVDSYYMNTTEYTVTAYDGADGSRWSQTLGPWQTSTSGGYNFMSISQMRMQSGNTNLVLYLEDERHRDHLYYLGLDTNGSFLWNLDLDSLNIRPVGLACKEIGGCLFAGLSSNPRHLMLWDSQGVQAGDFDLTATGISNSLMRNKQIVAWQDGAFRLLLADDASDPVNDERFLFHISLGASNATLSNQGDSLWRQAGDVRAQSLELNPYGYSIHEYGFVDLRIYDSSDTLLFDAGSLYTRLSGAPKSVAELADGRTVILEHNGGLIFLRDGLIEQRLVAPARLIPSSIVPLADSKRFMVIGTNGWAVYDLSGQLIWSLLPSWTDTSLYQGYGSLGGAEFSDGDLLLSGHIYALSIDGPILLYAARVGSDGSLRWQHSWTFDDSSRPSVLPLVIDDGQSEQPILTIANTSSASAQPAITLLKLDSASGDILQRRDLSPRGAGGEINRPLHRWLDADQLQTPPIRLMATPQGGFWLGYTSSALVSREIAYDKDGNPHSMPYGGDNMALIRFNADLEPDRLRIYGAGGDESLNDIHVLADGSLLVAGKTTSFALGWDGDDSNSGAVTDAWILRLDASGTISEGCQSLLASFDGAAASQYLGATEGTAFTQSTALSGSLNLASLAVDTQLGTRPASLIMAGQSLQTARMCLGTVTSPPLPDPPANGNYTLTLTIEGGPGAGQVFSLPLPSDFQCINSAEPTTVCSHSYASGTALNLLGDAFGGKTLNWSGCDMASSDGCVVTMDADRQVTASFTP